jgi:hypothetical protein
VRLSGTSWNAVGKDFSGESSLNLRGVSMVSSSEGLAVGTGGLWARWNGSQWIKRNGSATSPNYFGAGGIGGPFGFLTADNGLAYRWDGDSAGTFNTVAAGEIRAVSVIGTTEAYAVGTDRRVKRWNGTSWIDVGSQTSDELYGVWVVGSNGTGVAVGRSGAYYIITSGTTLGSRQNIGAQDLNAVHIASNGRGWIVGNNGVILRVDGTSVTNFAASPTSNNLYGVFTVSDQVAYAVGDGVILKYTAP